MTTVDLEFDVSAAPLDERTASASSDPNARPRTDWMIVVALQCEAPNTDPRAYGLEALTELSVGRGALHFAMTAASKARLEVADRRMSRRHALLYREADGWTIQDESSLNGVLVNGVRVASHALRDGDLVQCGGTFLIHRRTDASGPVAESLSRRPDALRTLSRPLGHEFELLAKVAPSTVPLAILGEPGSGSARIADAVHVLSGRAGRLLVMKTGPELLSELLNGGLAGATIFIEELAALDAEAHAALLRFLHHAEPAAQGAPTATPPDVRLIAASCRSAEQLRHDGMVRLDLYTRLRGYELRLPPLRERREDLGLLIAAALRRHAGGISVTISQDAAFAMFSYSWPFNVDELEACIARALAAGGAEIALRHLPARIRRIATGRAKNES